MSSPHQLRRKQTSPTPRTPRDPQHPYSVSPPAGIDDSSAIGIQLPNADRSKMVEPTTQPTASHSFTQHAAKSLPRLHDPTVKHWNIPPPGDRLTSQQGFPSTMAGVEPGYTFIEGLDLSRQTYSKVGQKVEEDVTRAHEIINEKLPVLSQLKALVSLTLGDRPPLFLDARGSEAKLLDSSADEPDTKITIKP
ncbi:phytanoyl- dioxygenase family protein, partial [Colletotrichum musicola]